MKAEQLWLYEISKVKLNLLVRLGAFGLYPHYLGKYELLKFVDAHSVF